MTLRTSFPAFACALLASLALPLGCATTQSAAPAAPGTHAQGASTAAPQAHKAGRGAVRPAPVLTGTPRPHGVALGAPLPPPPGPPVLPLPAAPAEAAQKLAGTWVVRQAGPTPMDSVPPRGFANLKFVFGPLVDGKGDAWMVPPHKTRADAPTFSYTVGDQGLTIHRGTRAPLVYAAGVQGRTPAGEGGLLRLMGPGGVTLWLEHTGDVAAADTPVLAEPVWLLRTQTAVPQNVWSAHHASPEAPAADAPLAARVAGAWELLIAGPSKPIDLPLVSLRNHVIMLHKDGTYGLRQAGAAEPFVMSGQWFLKGDTLSVQSAAQGEQARVESKVQLAPSGRLVVRREGKTFVYRRVAEDALLPVRVVLMPESMDGMVD